MPKPSPYQTWFVYIARCSDGSLYTGIARDVAARIAAHDAGRGARYTRGRGPLTLCAVRRCRGKGRALSLELTIKRLPRAAKEELLKSGKMGFTSRRDATGVAPAALASAAKRTRPSSRSVARTG